jgi:chromosome segregation ATPase
MTKSELEEKNEKLESANAELLNENNVLQKTIEAQKNLASAVEAKDKEISKARNDLEALKKANADLQRANADLLKTIEAQKHLGSAVEAKDKELAELRQRLTKATDAATASNAERDKTVSERFKTYEAEIRKLNGQLNKQIRIHGNLLKSLDGLLTNQLELNEYTYSEFKGV